MELCELSAKDLINPRKQLIMDRSDFPLTIRFGESTYILVVTKNDKVLLQKPLV